MIVVINLEMLYESGTKLHLCFSSFYFISDFKSDEASSIILYKMIINK